MSCSLNSRPIDAQGPLLLVHGGAWDIPDGVLEAHREGLEEVLSTASGAHQSDTEAVAGVTEAVAALERHGAFNAGYGAMLNQDGEVELDAGVMSGDTLDYGAVMAVRHVKHPIRLAARLLQAENSRMRMVAADGADRVAAAQGIDRVPNDELVHPRERRRYERLRARAEAEHPSRSFLPQDARPGGRDTVGAVMRDASGTLAAGTSTGGTPFKPSGRVGDAPIPGAGFYADAHVAVSTTGWGEAIAAVGLARDVRERVRDGATAHDAARKSLRRMHTSISSPDGEGATGGCIVVTPDDAAVAFTTPRMARGWRTDTDHVHFSVRRE